MSARPRPRPRPRPKVTSDNSTASTSAASLDTTSAKSPNSSTNDDDLFIRHDPNRLEAIYKQKKPREQSPVRDVKYFDANNTDESPESKRRRREMAPRNKPLPAWTQKPREVTAIPLESDDDSSEPEILDDDVAEIASPPAPQPRLRERSITPPPMHLRQQVGRQVKEVLRNLYDAEDDDDYHDFEGESQDAIQLLPELAAIQRNARATSLAPEIPETRSIELHIKWIPHPVQPASLEKELTSWTFNVPLNKPFGEIRRMLTGLPPLHPVLRWKSKKLFDGGTPATLIAGSKLEIQAMTQQTHEYFEERHQLPSSAPGSDAGEEEEAPGNSREASPAAAEKITLRLRTGPGDGRPQTVRVLADATVESVIAAFLNKTGRAGMQGVRLQIDGEDLEMDSTVADADLEDGDLVEVAGID